MNDAIELALDNCFDAVFAPETWPDAMDMLSASLGALGGCFNPHGVTADRLRLPASRRYRDMLGEFVRSGWQQQDVRATRGWPQALSGKPVVFEDDMSSAGERRSLPIYNELFAPHDMEMSACLGLRVGEEFWACTLVRSRNMGSFERDGSNDLLRVRPSLRRLLRIAGQMSVTAARGAMSAFHHAALGAVLIDWRGQVVELNATAAAMMGHDLDVRGRQLVAHNFHANGALQAIIASALRRSTVTGTAYIPRAEKAPLIVEAARLSSLRAEIFGFPGVLLLISDTEIRPRPHLDVLQQAFHLTPREAKVGQFLASGLDANEIATILDLRRSSVQQIIKSVLAKTNTRRQSALVAMFARLPVDKNVQ